MSVKGIKLRYFAMVLAVIAIVAGAYLTFFQTRGFVGTTATITAVDTVPSETYDEEQTYEVTVEYTVDGVKYTEKLDSYSPSYKVGKTVKIQYDPNDPSVIHSGRGIGIYFFIIGIVILAVAIISIVKEKLSLKKLKENTNGEKTTYPPSAVGAERELYFITDLGTPKYGHRIEDADRNVLYEAKMTKFTMTTPFGFDFIDHVNIRTTPHLIGHEESTEWNSIILDNHYTFTFDGEDIWKHLKRNGIRVDSSFGGGSGKLVGANYVIYRDDIEIARVESTSNYVHEEDAEEHGKIGSLVPIQGFFRIWTGLQDLDLLFVTLLAFARSGASDSSGGNYKTFFGTFKKNKS